MSFNIHRTASLVKDFSRFLNSSNVYLSGEAVLKYCLSVRNDKLCPDPHEITIAFSSDKSFKEINGFFKEQFLESHYFKISNNEAIFRVYQGFIRLLRYSTDLDLNRLYSTNLPLSCKVKSDNIGTTSYIDLSEESLRDPEKIRDFFVSDTKSILDYIRLEEELDVDFSMNCKIDKNKINYLDCRPSFEAILISDQCGRILRKLDSEGILFSIFPELEGTKKVPQHKGGRKMNLTEHIFLTVESSVPDLIVRWASLLHDIGKVYTMHFDYNKKKYSFMNHENVGAYIASNILNRFGYSNLFISRIHRLIKLHSFPFQYQRTPNWTDKAISRLKSIMGDDSNYLIELAIADKMASQNNIMMLENLYDLRKKLDLVGISSISTEITELSNNKIELKG